jgi:hypothetical protein
MVFDKYISEIDIQNVADQVEGDVEFGTEFDTAVRERIDAFINVNGPWEGINCLTSEEVSAVYNQFVEAVDKKFVTKN